MIRIASAQLWVHDQDEALAFYTEKIGLETRADVSFPEMGGFRWLTVGPAEQPDVVDRAHAHPRAAGLRGRDRRAGAVLMSKGAAGTIFLATDDCYADYERLSARGVEFVEKPEERPYGIDSGFRDPSGNHIRLTQVRELAAT